MYEGYWLQDEMSGDGTIKYINGIRGLKASRFVKVFQATCTLEK